MPAEETPGKGVEQGGFKTIAPGRFTHADEGILHLLGCQDGSHAGRNQGNRLAWRHVVNGNLLPQGAAHSLYRFGPRIGGGTGDVDLLILGVGLSTAVTA